MRRKIFPIILLAAAVCLGGCGKEEQERKELHMFEETSVMEEWKESLPQTQGEIQSEAIRGLSVEKGGEEVFTVAYAPKEYKSSFAYWEITAPYPSQATVNTETLYTLLGSLDGLQLAADDSGKTAQETGIADSDTYITIAVSSTGGDEADSLLRLQLGDSDGNGHVYAQAEGTDVTGLLPETAADMLLSIDPYNYILKIPVLPDIATVSDIEVEKDGELYTMSFKDGEYRMDAKKADEEEYNAAYQKLLGVLLTGEIPEGGAVDTEQDALLAVRFFRSTEEASDIEMTFYPYDDSSAAVCINGTAYFLADRDEVESLGGEFF